MASKFRNLNVNFRDVMGLSVSQRLDMLKSSEGQSILADFTPAQLADMFPRYYSERLPSVGKSLSRISGGKVGTDTTTAPTAEGRIQQKPVGGRSGTPTTLGERRQQQPSWMKNLEGVAPGISDPGAKAQLSREQKEVLDQLKKGAIPADDPRVAFMKDLSEADLKKAGIQRGDQGYSMAATSAFRMSEEEIKGNLKNSGAGGFTPRERATLDVISNREGSKDPNIIFGDSRAGGTGKYSRALGLDKRPLTEHSINEVLKMQEKLTQLTARDGVAGGRGTSAVGTGQMVRGTLEDNLKKLGIPREDWGKIKFDKNLQERLTLQNFRTSQIGDPNADPSTWNMMRLGQQYESLDTNKGFRSLTQSEINSIRNASSQRVNPNPTTEDIQRERQRIEQEQQSGLAGSLIPKLPQGIDAKFAEQYERLSPGQKQKFHEAILKLGEGDTQKGVSQFNQMYKTNPNITQQQISSFPQGEISTTSRVDEKHIKTAETRRLPIKTELKEYLDYAMHKNGISGFETTSGGQARIGTGGPRKGSTRHDEGNAVDGRFFTLNEKNERVYLPYTDARVKNSVRDLAAVIPGAGIGANYMGGTRGRADPSILHIGGPDKPGGAAIHYTGASGRSLGNRSNELDPYFNQGRDAEYRRQAQADFQRFKAEREEQAARARENRQSPPQSRVTEASPEEQKKLYEQAIQASPLRIGNREGTQTPQVTQPAIPAQPSSAPREQAPQQKPQPAQQGTPTALPAAATSPTPPTAAPEKKRQDEEESTDKQAFALGGETEAQGPLTAYAIDKDRMRRDDTIVTDGRVRFTMNSEKESMKYDPDTGQVKIDQARGEARQKISANDLQPVDRATEAEQPLQQEQKQIVPNQTAQSEPTPQQLPNSYETTLDLTNDIFKTSSFKRAVASSRFMKDSDPLGGHFDHGAYNIV